MNGAVIASVRQHLSTMREGDNQVFIQSGGRQRTVWHTEEETAGYTQHDPTTHTCKYRLVCVCVWSKHRCLPFFFFLFTSSTKRTEASLQDMSSSSSSLRMMISALSTAEHISDVWHRREGESSSPSAHTHTNHSDCLCQSSQLSGLACLSSLKRAGWIICTTLHCVLNKSSINPQTDFLLLQRDKLNSALHVI